MISISKSRKPQSLPMARRARENLSLKPRSQVTRGNAFLNLRSPLHLLILDLQRMIPLKVIQKSPILSLRPSRSPKARFKKNPKPKLLLLLPKRNWVLAVGKHDKNIIQSDIQATVTRMVVESNNAKSTIKKSKSEKSKRAAQS